MFLFFDTETAGLPKSWKAPVTQVNNWPHLVQLAYILCDVKGNRMSQGNHLVKPEGFSISKNAMRLHGITTEKAMAEGERLLNVLETFEGMVHRADYLVAHNMDFDEKIVGAEFLRNQMANTLTKKKKICTMKGSVDFCRISGPYGYKWPKLSELYYKLFRTDFDGAHDAVADTEATAKCFWELRRLGRI